LTSEEEYEDSVEDISSVGLIEPSASNPFITIAQGGDRIGTGAAQSKINVEVRKVTTYRRPQEKQRKKRGKKAYKEQVRGH